MTGTHRREVTINQTLRSYHHHHPWPRRPSVRGGKPDRHAAVLRPTASNTCGLSKPCWQHDSSVSLTPNGAPTFTHPD